MPPLPKLLLTPWAGDIPAHGLYCVRTRGPFLIVHAIPGPAPAATYWPPIVPEVTPQRLANTLRKMAATLAAEMDIPPDAIAPPIAAFTDPPPFLHLAASEHPGEEYILATAAPRLYRITLDTHDNATGLHWIKDWGTPHTTSPFPELRAAAAFLRTHYGTHPL